MVNTENVICVLVCFVVYIDVLSDSMRFSIRFCIYEHIQNYVFATIFENIFVRNDGDATLFFLSKLLPRPWDVSHRVERQEFMVKKTRRKYLWVSRKVVIWLTYFYIMVFVPMFYLKLCNHIHELKNK